jgi:hypothetical protein
MCEACWNHEEKPLQAKQIRQLPVLLPLQARSTKESWSKTAQYTKHKMHKSTRHDVLVRRKDSEAFPSSGTVTGGWLCSNVELQVPECRADMNHMILAENDICGVDGHTDHGTQRNINASSAYKE